MRSWAQERQGACKECELFQGHGTDVIVLLISGGEETQHIPLDILRDGGRSHGLTWMPDTLVCNCLMHPPSGYKKIIALHLAHH